MKKTYFVISKSQITDKMCLLKIESEIKVMLFMLINVWLPIFYEKWLQRFGQKMNKNIYFNNSKNKGSNGLSNLDSRLLSKDLIFYFFNDKIIYPKTFVNPYFNHLIKNIKLEMVKKLFIQFSLNCWIDIFSLKCSRQRTTKAKSISLPFFIPK